MTDLMKRLREWWHMPTTYCQKCGSPVPDCYALCFVCLSDERGRRIEELEVDNKALWKENGRMRGCLWNLAADPDYISKLWLTRC